jgi:hypothetical protein
MENYYYFVSYSNMNLISNYQKMQFGVGLKLIYIYLYLNELLKIGNNYKIIVLRTKAKMIMQIRDSKILILGGWGLVGSAICRELMKHSPAKLFISSLHKSEALDAVAQLRSEYQQVDPEMFVPKWGNIFTRHEWKDAVWSDVLNDPASRGNMVSDIFDELNDTILKSSSLYQLITEIKPDIVIDCINTATSIAYLDLYTTTQQVKRELADDLINKESIERLLTSMYIPQLIRHIQILYNGLIEAKTNLYLKIGTSGTGGMGLNIPYTHSEERPSRVLLSKSAVAGAQTLLLFLMARTPNGPIIKEIKPTAAIAWKKIAYGKVMRKGKPIPLVDLLLKDAHKLSDKFNFSDFTGIIDCGKDFESVFIDTGENGIFSKGEFEAIGSLGQMEIVTPEEIATYAVYEIAGGNTGRDVIQGLDSSTLGPTYRGGMFYNKAVDKLNQLEGENSSDSIAFEMLGPPRLSKLLYEANILKRISISIKTILEENPDELSEKALKLITENSNLRSQMLSIGLVILLPDGINILRGKDVKIPSKAGLNEIPIDRNLIEKWCYEAWVDLRANSFKRWQETFKNIIDQTNNISANDTSSRFTYTLDYWNNFNTIDEGKIVGWIFEHEDSGWRFKR